MSTITTQATLTLCGGYLAVPIKSQTNIPLDQTFQFQGTFKGKEFYTEMTKKKKKSTKMVLREINIMVKINKNGNFQSPLYENREAVMVHPQV